MSSVCIRNCATIVEAKVCVGLLEARGFNPLLANGHHAQQDWRATQALGGVQILLPTCQLEEAKNAIMEAEIHGPSILAKQFGEYERPIKYGRIAIWFMIAMEVGVFQFVSGHLLITIFQHFPLE